MTRDVSAVECIVAKNNRLKLRLSHNMGVWITIRFPMTTARMPVFAPGWVQKVWRATSSLLSPRLYVLNICAGDRPSPRLGSIALPPHHDVLPSPSHLSPSASSSTG
jgi:hypothetical protein